MNYFAFLRYCIWSKGGISIKDMDFFQLIHYHLEERQTNNIQSNLQKDIEYLKATQLKSELCNQYDRLDLTDEQRKVINQWIDAIHAQECAYTAVVFRMEMQCRFALLLELADLK